MFDVELKISFNDILGFRADDSRKMYLKLLKEIAVLCFLLQLYLVWHTSIDAVCTDFFLNFVSDQTVLY